MRAASPVVLVLLAMVPAAHAQAPIPLDAVGLAWSPTNPLDGAVHVGDLCSGQELARVRIWLYTQHVPVRITLDPDPCAGGVGSFGFTLTNEGAGFHMQGTALLTQVPGTNAQRFDAVVTGTYFGRVWALADTGGPG